MGNQTPAHIVTEIAHNQHDIKSLMIRAREVVCQRIEPAGVKKGTVIQKRRIDAAVPNRARVGQQMELLVQVRFPNSSPLGIKDWPTLKKPDSIDQTSESFKTMFPRDPETGQTLPARLEVQIVAPSFQIEGASRQILEVPPRAISKRIAFLLTAVKLGDALIHVEVYGMDLVCLGTLPLETSIVETGITPSSSTNMARMSLMVSVEQGAKRRARRPLFWVGIVLIICFLLSGFLFALYIAPSR
jgi:hypothetical protein